MAKPKTVAVSKGGRTIEIENEAQLLENLTPDDFELEQAAEELEGAQGATVTIYRQGAHGRDWTFIDTIMPSQYSPVMLKHAPYNGGTFRIVMRHADGTIRVNRVLPVEPAPQPAIALQPAGVPSLAGEQGVAILGKAMVEGFGRIGEAMAKLGELVVGQRTGPAATPPGLRDLLGDVQALKDLIAPAVPASDPLAMLQSLLGIVKELPGRGGDDDAPRRGSATEMDVLLEAAKVIMPQIAAAAGANAPAQPRPMIAPPQRPPLTVVPAQPAGTPAAQAVPAVNPAAMLVNFLVDQAKRANDPDAYAVVVLDNVPPEIVTQWTTRDDWFEEICKIAPDAAPFRGWFDKLRTGIIGYLTNDEIPVQNGDGSVQGSPPNVAAAPGS